MDPGLYLEEKNAMFYATQKRELPDAFQLFMGESFHLILFFFCDGYSPLNLVLVL